MSELTRPIIGIENRTAQEVFDIMCDRFRRTPSPSPALGVVEATGALQVALDLLQEKIYGNPARSAAHNAQHYIKKALASLAQGGDGGEADYRAWLAGHEDSATGFVKSPTTPANPARGVSGQDVRTACEWLANHVGNISLRDWDPCANVLLQAADRLDELTAAIGAEDPRWQKLRDLFGLDGWHDGLWSGIPNPDQIINHIEHIANERARLLKAHIDAQPEAAIGAGGQAVGYARAVDVDPANRPFEGRNSFWVSERQNAYYSVPIYLAQPHPADERVVEALPRPDAVSMVSGTICLEYVDTDERDLAFDWLEAHGAGVALAASHMPVGDGDYFSLLVERARQAAEKASAKFPQPNYIALKIAEEAGEVVRGAVHYAENRMEWIEVEGEIVQLLAMIIRFVTEGDLANGIVPPLAASTGEANHG